MSASAIIIPLHYSIALYLQLYFRVVKFRLPSNRSKHSIISEYICIPLFTLPHDFSPTSNPNSLERLQSENELRSVNALDSSRGGSPYQMGPCSLRIWPRSIQCFLNQHCEDVPSLIWKCDGRALAFVQAILLSQDFRFHLD